MRDEIIKQFNQVSGSSVLSIDSVKVKMMRHGSIDERLQLEQISESRSLSDESKDDEDSIARQ